MSEIDRRIASTMAGLTPQYACRVDTWFAWRPVFTGALGMLGGGKLVWLRYVRRDRCMGCTLYQEIPKR